MLPSSKHCATAKHVHKRVFCRRMFVSNAPSLPLSLSGGLVHKVSRQLGLLNYYSHSRALTVTLAAQLRIRCAFRQTKRIRLTSHAFSTAPGSKYTRNSLPVPGSHIKCPHSEPQEQTPLTSHIFAALHHWRKP